ncbi:MAG: 3'-5' exonuclease [Gammaproteobacteria bacterium]|nr:MAG: 3'-5' exonuclease [Gammaproteobacteria bacterium]
MSHVLVFDIETVPDVEAGRAILGLHGLSDASVAEAMFARQRANNGREFLPHHLHKVVAISVVMANHESVRVWSLGSPEDSEADLVRRFFDGVEKFSPVLVSWNGTGFDLPVLHYRALKHGVASPTYWETGDEIRDFRFNNYLSRYHARHTDLMDVLAGYTGRANAPLDEVATMLGFPGKMGMSGAKVWEAYQAGDIKKIRDYCETDVLNTYLVYLQFERIRGRLSEGGLNEKHAQLKSMLAQHSGLHLQAFLNAWDSTKEPSQ